jgi:hypothetical protein
MKIIKQVVMAWQCKRIVKNLAKYWRLKFSMLTGQEIERLHMDKTNTVFDAWYEALKAYACTMEDGERSWITDCGVECWRQSYDDGMTVHDAFRQGFEE